MKVSHAPAAVSAAFDDPNLVSCAGLVPVVELAQRCGLADLVTDRVTLREPGGVNAHLKVLALVAGADSIEDMDVLRHGAMTRLFTGVRAPSTLGTFLRTFRFGHVRQLDAVAATLLARLASAPRCCRRPARSRSSISTTRSSRPTATPSRARGTATPG